MFSGKRKCFLGAVNSSGIFMSGFPLVVNTSNINSDESSVSDYSNLLLSQEDSDHDMCSDDEERSDSIEIHIRNFYQNNKLASPIDENYKLVK